MEFLITYGLLFLHILHTPVVVASAGLPTSSGSSGDRKYSHISHRPEEEDSIPTSSPPTLSSRQPFRLSRSSRTHSSGFVTETEEKEEIARTISPIDRQIAANAHEISRLVKRLGFPLKRSGDFSSSHITPKVSNDNPNPLPVTTPASSLSNHGFVKKNVQSLSFSENIEGGAPATDKNSKEEEILPKPETLKSSNRTTGGTVTLRGACNFTEQCFGEHTECRVGICKCAPGFLPRIDNGDMCGDASSHNVEVPQADPTMIGVVVGLAFMSITLCVVLQLFARAQFRENRTIFNTPNPRLMNASLLKGSKTLLRGNSAGQRSRRGSQVSVASGGGHDDEHAQKIINANVEFGGGGGGPGGASSSHSGGSRPGRSHHNRQLSTDKESTPTVGRHIAKGKNFRQDSIGSNALDASSL